MKKNLIVLMLIVFASASINAQLTFTVKPGLNLNSANVGYSLGKITPYAGFQLYNFTGSFDRIYGIDTTDQKIRMTVCMPYLGAKYTVAEKEKLQASLHASIFKPFIFGKEIDNGEAEDIEQYDPIGLLGAELSFSAEYFFDPQFSIGGEFGYRMGKLRYKEEDLARDEYWLEKYLVNTTFTAISFNFYFK